MLTSLTITAVSALAYDKDDYSASFSAPETMKIFGNDKVSEVDDEHIEYEIEERREEFAKHFHLRCTAGITEMTEG